MAGEGGGKDPVVDLVHELRTPLAVVAGFAELLDRNGQTLNVEQRADYLHRIAEGAKQLSEILDRARREVE